MASRCCGPSKACPFKTHEDELFRVELAFRPASKPFIPHQSRLQPTARTSRNEFQQPVKPCAFKAAAIISTKQKPEPCGSGFSLFRPKEGLPTTCDGART